MLKNKIGGQHENKSYISGAIIIVLLATFTILIFPMEAEKKPLKQVNSGPVKNDIPLQHTKLNPQKSGQQNNIISQQKAKIVFVSHPVTPQQTITDKAVPAPLIPQQTQGTQTKLTDNMKTQRELKIQTKQNNITISQKKMPNRLHEANAEKKITRPLSLKQNTIKTMAKRNFYRLTMNVATQFPRGSSQISPALQHRLSEIAKLLKNRGASVIHIIGYCDRTGSQERNVYLSVQRADATANFLVHEGISRNHIFTEGHGFSEPVSLTNAALNRRVEIFYKQAQPELASNGQ